MGNFGALEYPGWQNEQPDAAPVLDWSGFHDAGMVARLIKDVSFTNVA